MLGKAAMKYCCYIIIAQPTLHIKKHHSSKVGEQSWVYLKTPVLLQSKRWAQANTKSCDLVGCCHDFWEGSNSDSAYNTKTDPRLSVRACLPAASCLPTLHAQNCARQRKKINCHLQQCCVQCHIARPALIPGPSAGPLQTTPSPPSVQVEGPSWVSSVSPTSLSASARQRTDSRATGH